MSCLSNLDTPFSFILYSNKIKLKKVKVLFAMGSLTALVGQIYGQAFDPGRFSCAIMMLA